MSLGETSLQEAESTFSYVSGILYCYISCTAVNNILYASDTKLCIQITLN